MKLGFIAMSGVRCHNQELMDMGLNLPKLPDEAKTESNRVHGCQSNVWLVADAKDSSPPTIEFLANSDAVIVNGLIAVIIALYSGKTPHPNRSARCSISTSKVRA